jgi:hypothetical protein
MKIIFSENDEKQLIEAANNTGLYLEGNLLKIIESESDFKEYLKIAKDKDKESREKRLSLTKVIQDQNESLIKKAEENEHLMGELKEALAEAENAKQEALNDLDLMHKKSQFELINTIVNYALYVIVGTGIFTTGLYVFAMIYSSAETTLIGNTWSNLFGILLTNSFSIIGTIMGVKYANGKDDNRNEKLQ